MLCVLDTRVRVPGGLQDGTRFSFLWGRGVGMSRVVGAAVPSPMVLGSPTVPLA